MNKRRGFTLIEINICIFIMMMIFTAAISLSAMESSIRKDMEHEADIYEIQNLCTLGKLICRSENSSGYLVTNSYENKAYFGCNSKGNVAVKAIQLSPYSYFPDKTIRMELSNEGKFKEGRTIFVKSGNEIKSVTIGVGVDTVRIKE